MKGLCGYWVVLIALLIPATLVWPAGLGDITIRSALDRPLSAEINLLDVHAEDLEKIQVRHAIDSELQKFAIQAPTMDPAISFILNAREDGLPIISVTSIKPVRQPLVQFLIVLEVPGGNVYQEYRFLLSPSNSNGTGLTRVVAPIMPKVIRSGNEEQVNSDKADTLILIMAGSSYGPVRLAENLITIAKAIDVSRTISIYQKLYAILINNPHAFIEDNMNLLRAGVVLDIPWSKQIEAISRVLAMETYTRQVAEWQEYRLKFQANTMKGGYIQQSDPAMELMKATVEELRKEIEKLRLLLASSVSAENLAVELKEEEALYRKQLEEDILRLELSKSRLLETIATIATPPVSEENQPSDANFGLIVDGKDLAISTESTGGGRESNANRIIKIDPDSQEVLNLQERVVAIEERLQYRESENERLQTQIEILRKKEEEAVGLIQDKDDALALAEEQIAVYGAALEFLGDETSSLKNSEIIVEEQVIDKLTASNNTKIEVSREEERHDIEDISQAPIGGLKGLLANNQSNRYSFLGVGVGLGLLLSVLIILIKKSRTRSVISAIKSDNGISATPMPKTPELFVKPDTFRDPRPVTHKEDISGEAGAIGIDTKLDLARAYIEMKDYAAAHELLNEVKIKGNNRQKTEARQLTDAMK